ncbi:competence/damage-inducible protein A [Egibacter rhizosphaerae]|uniref:CinA-like protein n=1 Tax=Egibacter rhizosphaerae TaxID=1670831 RepID=A0A411YJJ4_9ACTN|nr:competence/damage-inducible protein A [Egibacter rhizosphaerae]QBI21276.1 competence/damage-inducible protein A [Egibacter rhizosphaerae]
MRAEIVAVGSELLLGDGVDTNSAWISARLNEIGVNVHRHVTVGDNDERLRAVLVESCGRAEVVVVTGGLGPTQDDRTRDIVAELAGVPLERDEQLVSYLERYFADRGREMTENNLRQADLPSGSRILAPAGTAAGFAVECSGATIWCLPGVPWEMRTLVERELVPTLAAQTGAWATVSRLVRTAGMGESQVAERCADLVDRLDAQGNPTIAFLASKGETRVRVTGRAETREQALALIDPVVDELVDRLGAGFAGLDDEGAEHAIARQLGHLGWTLAVGESLTGGSVGGRLVHVPGASQWFRGGVTAYATDAKPSLLGVSRDLLDRHGPASQEAAIALAAGARDRLETDVGLGLVGVAGPEPQQGAEVGTVHLAVVLPDPSGLDAQQRSRTVRLPAGGRDTILDFATSAALDYVRRRLAEAMPDEGSGPAPAGPSGSGTAESTTYPG